MKLKYKIRLGFALIFISILFAGSLSLFYINRLSQNARVILKNNYETLSFTKGMRAVLDDNNLPLTDAAKSAFNTQLVKQEHNVTEKGEDAATASVRSAFSSLQATAGNLAQQQRAEHEIRAGLRKIEDLNMQAIVRKTDAAEASVDNATIILGLIGCFTFLALFSFSVNITGIISEPLIALTDGLGEVSRKNFDHRLNFSKGDEFGQVAAAFNDMGESLKSQEQDSLHEVLSEKQRIKTIIEHMHDAIVVVNEQQEIVFINTAAQNLLNLEERNLSGKPVRQLMVNNATLRSVIENESDTLKISHDGKESLFRMESIDIFVPNTAALQPDEVNIARIAAGKIYVLRNLAEYQHI
jgi:two-component system, NtrC family, sensor histidine kinase KinB